MTFHFNWYCFFWFWVGAFIGALIFTIHFKKQLRERWKVTMKFVEITTKLAVHHSVTRTVNARLFQIVNKLLGRN